MDTLPPYRQIAALRLARGETLAQFAAAIGCSSKSRVSEFENGKAKPTVAQALRLEELSGGRIDAATLNQDVALARKPLAANDGDPAQPWQLTPSEVASLPDLQALPAEVDRVLICDVCEARLDRDAPRACTFVDCPHAVRNAA